MDTEAQVWAHIQQGTTMGGFNIECRCPTARRFSHEPVQGSRVGGGSPFEALLGQQQALEKSQAGCHDADDWGHQAIKQTLVWPLWLLFLARGG